MDINQKVEASKVVIEAIDVTKMYNLWHTPLAALYVPLARRIGRTKSVPSQIRRWCQRKADEGVTPFCALERVSLTVRLGESVAIIGRNGSGKSTLLKILAGTLQPTEGRVQVRGKVAALLELGSGFNPEFTGKENVYLNATVLGLSKKRIDQVYSSILEFSEIGEFIDQPVKTYSSGMLMRLAFSVMIHVDADVLIVDEALAVGDAFFVQKCMRWITEFQTRGTLLFVTHSVGTARGLCSKALWLEKGVVQEFGESKRVTESYFSRHAVDQSSVELKEPNEDLSVTNEITKKSAQVAVATPTRQAEFLVEYPTLLTASASRGIIDFQSAKVADSSGTILKKFYSNQDVWVECDFLAVEDVPSGWVVGFVVKDHLGQSIFGEASWDLDEGSRNNGISSGTVVQARFNLRFPTLRAGSYFLDVGINLNMETALLLQHDAIHLNVVASNFAFGTFYVPCSQITIKCE